MVIDCANKEIDPLTKPDYLFDLLDSDGSGTIKSSELDPLLAAVLADRPEMLAAARESLPDCVKHFDVSRECAHFVEHHVCGA